MMHTNVVLPSIRSSVVNLREKIRDASGKVGPGDYITFSFDRSETADDYRKLIEEYGLSYEKLDPGTFTFKRPGRIERWEYAFPAVGLNDKEFPKEWQCLDIGCGRKAWPRANEAMDTNEDMAKYVLPGQNFKLGTITQRTEYKDKQFDFATCFHVLEHVNDPVAAAKEISRIAKQGLIEVPHPTKDGMLLFHETDHRWFVMPAVKPGGPLYFHKIDPDWWGKLHDQEAIGAIGRSYLHNLDYSGDQAILRNYFTRIEPLTNIIHHWQDKLEVVIIA